jgi:large subunit ribosomal protein L43
MAREEIIKWVESYRGRGGYPEMHFKSYMNTAHPSIQGLWTPFTRKAIDRNLLKYPQESLNASPLAEPSTTEIVSKMYGDGSFSAKQAS